MKIFKKTFKFICDECGEFTHTETEYCEKCGVQAIRKATNEDYTRYEMEKMRDTKEQRIEIEKAEETRKVAERAEVKAEKVAEKAGKAAQKAEIEVEKAAKKAKRKAEKAKRKAEKLA